MRSELPTLVLHTLAGDAASARKLVALLYPVVLARIVRVQRRSHGAKGGPAHVQPEDRVQDVFVALFERGGKVLRSWDPERGLSLQNFVGLFAERRTISWGRGARPATLAADVTLDELADSADGPTLSIESALATREFLATLLDRLREELTPLAMHLFQLVYVEERSVEEIVASTNMSAEAIYAWRSRLRRMVSRLATDLLAAGSPAKQPPSGDLGHAG